MDNTAQKQNTGQDNQSVQTVQPTSINQATQSVQPPAKQIQVEPAAASINKEKEISRFQTENVKPSEEEPKIEAELQSAGIAAVNTDKPNLDKIHEQIGVAHSGENTPVKSEPSAKIVLPISEDDAESVLKNKKTTFNLHENVGEFAGDYNEDSLPFLAALVVKVVKEMHRRVFRRK